MAEKAPCLSPLGPREFAKYHALGNDYLVLDGTHQKALLTPQAARAICDRHLGVGSDGVLVYRGLENGAARLVIFNPDGSLAERSGNGLRIFARFLHDFGYVAGDTTALLTASGPAQAKLLRDGAEVKAIAMQMGRATFVPPALGPGVELANQDVAWARRFVWEEGEAQGYCVNVGNPHCVVFVDALSEEVLRRVGPALERHPAFTRGTNVQLAHIVSRKQIELLIWERGAHETRASGSSSCAVAAAAFRRGLVDGEITMRMPGGELHVQIDQQMEITMTGPASPICRGTFLGA